MLKRKRPIGHLVGEKKREHIWIGRPARQIIKRGPANDQPPECTINIGQGGIGGNDVFET